MNILSAMQERTLLCDGAMGTQLQAAGLSPGECGEAWNLTHSDRVLSIQKAYVEAGSDCLTTNTFGATSLALARHGLQAEVTEINRRAVQIARQAFGSRSGFVLGDLGPFGGLMEPYGTTSASDVRAAFFEQAVALVQAGVDALLIETQTALEEMEIALEASAEAGGETILASMAFDLSHDGSDVRTMMGVTPEQAAELMASKGASAIGTNCGRLVDSAWAARILTRYSKVSSLPLFAQPNAGQPEIIQGQISYAQSAEETVQGLPMLLGAGASLIGACCGSTPEHIRALREALDQGDT